jgi:4a-hydroxytetrahydrobiopterin dehydratase
MMTDQRFSSAHCRACRSGEIPLDARTVAELLQSVPSWSEDGDFTWIKREFRFRDFPTVMLFANAIAWMAQRENHHPVLELSYDRCVVRYSTYAIRGLSENDFICAAKVNALLERDVFGIE